MTFPVHYQPAAKVAPGPTPGAKALMAWCLANYPPGTNLGIYNPRNVRGGVALSLHAEGRAIDVGYPVSRPDGYHMGQLLAGHMATFHAALGVQCVIFARRIWSNTRPTWRPYTGTADHFDHVHIELTREAAAGLTTDIIRQTLEATTVPTLPENDPGARIQRAINANGLQPPLKVDGDCGKVTADGLDKVLAYLNGAIADLKQANATSADTIKRLRSELDGANNAGASFASELANVRKANADLSRQLGAAVSAMEDAKDNREAAEAEAARLRAQLQTGGRMPQLLADLDAAQTKLEVARDMLSAAMAKARA